ncbi:ATP-dependent Clp protease proteolytic subunit-related protein 2, chloroplastic [Hordeum vulgare]|nr:ATP-dependent Clp protease proteolytic subunit-related protein 2, chloroplastic [Hordeum vulgare]
MSEGPGRFCCGGVRSRAADLAVGLEMGRPGVGAEGLFRSPRYGCVRATASAVHDSDRLYFSGVTNEIVIAGIGPGITSLVKMLYQFCENRELTQEDIPCDKLQAKSSGSVLSYVGVACLGAILFGYHLGLGSTSPRCIKAETFTIESPPPAAAALHLGIPSTSHQGRSTTRHQVAEECLQNTESSKQLHALYTGKILLTPCMALYDTMLSLKSPIGTHCLGFAFNLAGFILAAGEKADDLENESNELNRIKNYLYGKLAENTGQSVEKVSIFC